jgi:ubiquinone biosynthesis protein
MAISLKPQHLKRYKDIARLFIKYGRSDLLSHSGLEEAFTEGERQEVGAAELNAEALAGDLEKMGPIYVKLGQVLSSRADLLPAPYLKALSRLQDQLEPFSFTEVEETVQHELGVRLSKAFIEFEATPIATASLGQVHRAALRDGRPVAVKVQRPGIRQQIAQDLEVLSEIAEFLDRHTEMGRRYQLLDILDQFRQNLIRELDYQREARYLQQIGENLRDFDRIIVPGPVEEYTTSRVLTMDFIRGKKITSLGPLAPMELDLSHLAEELFRAYLHQILVDGLFHADPHPGNILVTEDGKLALIDLGMVGRVSPGMQEQMLKLLLAVSEGHSDEAADLAIKIGEAGEEFQEQDFRRRVAELVEQHQDTTVEEIQVGRSMLEFSRVSSASGMRMPPELTMLGKTLLNLDEVGRSLAPQFDPNEAIRRNAAEIVRLRLRKSISAGHVFAAAMEAKEFVAELPRRVNRILDAAARNELKFQIDAIDESTLIEGFQKVANRITMGLILAALIMGAAMLMQVETRFRLLGYPGLAILCFLAAAGGGFWLVISILLSDRGAKRKH